MTATIDHQGAAYARVGVVGVCLTAFLFLGCGGDSSTSPSPNVTQARIESNDGWHLTVNGAGVAMGGGTVGRMIDLGSGSRCATGQLSWARLPHPADGSYLTVMVGQSTATTRADGGLITVCGEGPTPKQYPRG